MRAIAVIPTYNEAENLPVLVDRMTAAAQTLPEGTTLDMVAVDDASPDGTGDLADKIVAQNPHFHVIHRIGKRGYSPACKEGLAWALRQGYDLVITMDADLSHDPSVIPSLIAAVQSGADVAIGSRYVEGGQLEVCWGPFRRAVSQAGSAYARTMVGTDTQDCTSGFRCYRATVLQQIPFLEIHSEGYSFLIEMLAELRDRGAIVTEVPITYVDRCAGASKISKKIIAEAFWITTELGMSRAFGGRRKPREQLSH